MTPSAAMTIKSQENQHRVRLRDIAQLAGVHITTVSSVLSPRSKNHTRVSEKTAERIRELAHKLNYRPDHHAQMMRRKNTGIIAILDTSGSALHSRRAISLIRAIQENGYYPLVVNHLWYMETLGRSPMQTALDYVINSRPEGIVLATPSIQFTEHLIPEVLASKIPCVSFNGVYVTGIPQVRSDAEAGFRDMTRHLIAGGHRKLGLIVHWGTSLRDESTCWPTLERIRGFTSAIREAGGDVYEGLSSGKKAKRGRLNGTIILPDDPKPVLKDNFNGYRLARTILDANYPMDALVCSSDEYALGAIRACFEKGVSVPEQLAITGFGGGDEPLYYSPSLTSVGVLTEESATQAIDILLKIIRKEQPRATGNLWKTPCNLIIRESCGVSGRKEVCNEQTGASE